MRRKRTNRQERIVDIGLVEVLLIEDDGTSVERPNFLSPSRPPLSTRNLVVSLRVPREEKQPNGEKKEDLP